MFPDSIMDLLSLLAGPLLIAASVILYIKTRSPWMLAAAVLEILSLLFRVALFFGAQQLVGMPLFMGAWQLIGLLMAVCFLGFAITWRSEED